MIPDPEGAVCIGNCKGVEDAGVKCCDDAFVFELLALFPREASG